MGYNFFFAGGISHPTLVNNHDHYKASQVSCGRAISSYPGKKLLVLDINGLLADIVIGVPKGYKPFKKIYGKAGHDRLISSLLTSLAFVSICIFI